MSDHFEDEFAHRPSEHAEEDGEPWLVSYADMMTLLFGFFVLMYSFASAKVDETSEDWIKVKREVAAFFGQSNTAENENSADNSGSGSGLKRSDQEGNSLSDVPVVPFESKFRYLATRDEMVDEVSALLRTLTERASGPAASVAERQTMTEVKILQAMLQRVGTGTQTVVEGPGGRGSEEDPSAAGGDRPPLGAQTSAKPGPTKASTQTGGHGSTPGLGGGPDSRTGSGADTPAEPATRDDLQRTGQEVSLILDSRNLLGGSETSFAFAVTQLGAEILDQLADRLLGFKRPLHITTEARRTWKGPGKPSQQDRARAFSDTSRKAVAIAERLQLMLDEKSKGAGLGPNPHIFSVAGLGYFSGRGQEAELDETIVFRVNILSTQRAGETAGGP